MQANDGTGVAVANEYFAAWNRRDPAAVRDMFADGGTYTDPATRGPLVGDAIATYVGALCRSFPDLSFEIVSLHQVEPDLFVAQWMMNGTNRGEFHGLPPTGRSITLPGMDYLRVEGDRVRSVIGYFDTQAVPQQLGLQVVVQPYAVGPFEFGTSTAVQSGKTVKPGAFSITQLISHDEAEVQEVRLMSREVAKEMSTMEGFIGLVMARLGNRGVTISAWENAEQPRQLMTSAAHGGAMRRFFSDLRSGSAYTSVWVPARINAMWVTCGSCAKTSDYEKVGGRCPCGEALPAMPAYW